MEKALFCLFLGFCLAGCRRAPDASGHALPQREEINALLRAVQQLHGPPRERWDLTKLASSPLAHDLNGDGQPEFVLFFTDKGLGDLNIRSVSDLKSDVTCGFIVLTRIEGRTWPVFYYFTDYRTQLSFKTVLNTTGIVAEGGGDGLQTVWGWEHGNAFWPAHWTAWGRTWDRTKEDYGPRYGSPRYSIACSKAMR